MKTTPPKSNHKRTTKRSVTQRKLHTAKNATQFQSSLLTLAHRSSLNGAIFNPIKLLTTFNLPYSTSGNNYRDDNHSFNHDRRKSGGNRGYGGDSRGDYHSNRRDSYNNDNRSFGRDKRENNNFTNRSSELPKSDNNRDNNRNFGKFNDRPRWNNKDGNGGLDPGAISWFHNQQRFANKSERSRSFIKPRENDLEANYTPGSGLVDIFDIVDDWEEKSATYNKIQVAKREKQLANKFFTEEKKQQRQEEEFAREGINLSNLKKKTFLKDHDDNDDYDDDFIDLHSKKHNTSSYVLDDEDGIPLDQNTPIRKEKGRSRHKQKIDTTFVPSSFYSENTSVNPEEDAIEKESQLRHEVHEIQSKMSQLNTKKKNEKDEYLLLRQRIKATKDIIKQLQGGRMKSRAGNTDLFSFEKYDDHGDEIAIESIDDGDENDIWSPTHTTKVKNQDLTGIPLKTQYKQRIKAELDQYNAEQAALAAENPSQDAKMDKNNPIIKNLIQTSRIYRDLLKSKEVVHVIGTLLGSFDILPALSKDLQQGVQQITKYRQKYKHLYDLELNKLVVDTITNDQRVTQRLAGVKKGRGVYAHIQRHAREKIDPKTGEYQRNVVGSYGTDYDTTDITLGMHRISTLKHQLNTIYANEDMDDGYVEKETKLDEKIAKLSQINNVLFPDQIIFNMTINILVKEALSAYPKALDNTPEQITPSLLQKDQILNNPITSSPDDIIPKIPEAKRYETDSLYDSSHKYEKGLQRYIELTAMPYAIQEQQKLFQHPAILMAVRMLDYMAYTAANPSSLVNFVKHRQERLVKEEMIRNQEDESILQEYIAAFSDKRSRIKMTSSGSFNPGKRSAALYQELLKLKKLQSALDQNSGVSEVHKRANQINKVGTDFEDDKSFENSDFDNDIDEIGVNYQASDDEDWRGSSEEADNGEEVFDEQKLTQIKEQADIIKTKLLARAKAKLDLKRRFIGLFVDPEDMMTERPNMKHWLRNEMLGKYSVEPIEADMSENAQQSLPVGDSKNPYDQFMDENNNLKLSADKHSKINQNVTNMMENHVNIKLSPTVDNYIKQHVSKNSRPTMASFMPLIKTAGEHGDLVLTQALLLRLIQWDVLFNTNTELTSLKQQYDKLHGIYQTQLDYECSEEYMDHLQQKKAAAIKKQEKLNKKKFIGDSITLDDFDNDDEHVDEYEINSRTLQKDLLKIKEIIDKFESDLASIQHNIFLGLSSQQPMSILQTSQFILFWNRLLNISSQDFAPLAQHQLQLQTSADGDEQHKPHITEWPSWLFPSRPQKDALSTMSLFEGIDFESLHPPPTPVSQPGRPMWPIMSPTTLPTSILHTALSSCLYSQFWEDAFHTTPLIAYTAHYHRVKQLQYWLQLEIAQDEQKRLFPSLYIDDIIKYNTNMNEQRTNTYHSQLAAYEAQQKELHEQKKKNRKSKKFAPDGEFGDNPKAKATNQVDVKNLIPLPHKPILLPTEPEAILQKHYNTLRESVKQMMSENERLQRLSTCTVGWLNSFNMKSAQQSTVLKRHFSYGLFHILSYYFKTPTAMGHAAEGTSQQLPPLTYQFLHQQYKQQKPLLQHSVNGIQQDTFLTTLYPSVDLYQNLFTLNRQLFFHSFNVYNFDKILPIMRQFEQDNESFKENVAQLATGNLDDLSVISKRKQAFETVQDVMINYGLLPLISQAAPAHQSKVHNIKLADDSNQTTTVFESNNGELPQLPDTSKPQPKKSGVRHQLVPHSALTMDYSVNRTVNAFLSTIPRTTLSNKHRRFLLNKNNFHHVFIDLGSGDGEHALAHANQTNNQYLSSKLQAQTATHNEKKVVIKKPDVVIACDILPHRLSAMLHTANHVNNNKLYKTLDQYTHSSEDVDALTNQFDEFNAFDFLVQEIDVPESINTSSPRPQLTIQNSYKKSIVQTAQQFAATLDRQRNPISSSSSHQFPAKLSPDLVHETIADLLTVYSAHIQGAAKLEQLISTHGQTLFDINPCTNMALFSPEQLLAECYSTESLELFTHMRNKYSSKIHQDIDIILSATPSVMFGDAIADKSLLLTTPYDFINSYDTNPKVNKYRLLYNPSHYDESSSVPPKQAPNQMLPQRELPNLFAHCGVATTLLASMETNSITTINLTHPPPPTTDSYFPSSIDINNEHHLQQLARCDNTLLSESMLLLAARCLKRGEGSIYIMSDDNRVALFLNRCLARNMGANALHNNRRKLNDENALNNTTGRDNQIFDASSIHLSRWFDLQELNLNTGKGPSGITNQFEQNGDDITVSRYQQLHEKGKLPNQRPTGDGRQRAWKITRNDLPWE